MACLREAMWTIPCMCLLDLLTQTHRKNIGTGKMKGVFRLKNIEIGIWVKWVNQVKQRQKVAEIRG
jgi:hypothetical protein